MKISIVMPAYNEEKRIEKTLEAYSEFFERLRGEGKIDYELLVVINGTTDRTLEIVEEFSRTRERIIFINLAKGGKGYAITEGFKKSLKKECDLVGFVDVDMATSPEEYWKIVEKIRNYDGVIADRYLPEAKVYPPNTFRRLAVSRIFNILVRGLFFFTYRDTQCGAKVFRKEAIDKVLPRLSFSLWAFDVDLLYNLKKCGFRIRSVPTVWVDKEYSKINFWKAGPWMASGVLRLRLLNSFLKDFVRFYDFVMDSVKSRKK